MINRSNLANALERLAAETETRVRSTAHDGVETAKEVATTAAHQAAAIAGVTTGRMQAGVESLRSSIEHSGLPAAMRRPVPLGALLSGTAVAVIVIYLVSRRRQ